MFELSKKIEMDKLTELKRHNCILEESSKMQQKTMELE